MSIKILLAGILVLVISASVLALNYSNPTYEDGSLITYQHQEIPTKQDCVRGEWNSNFEDFRNGDISKEDMKVYVGGCRW